MVSVLWQSELIILLLNIFQHPQSSIKLKYTQNNIVPYFRIIQIIILSKIIYSQAIDYIVHLLNNTTLNNAVLSVPNYSSASTYR